PEKHHVFTKRRPASYALAALFYIPAALLILAEALLRNARLRAMLPLSAVNMRALLWDIEIALFAVSLVVTTALLIRTFRSARTVVVRQQLKWVMWGMGIAATLFATLYVPSYFTSPSVSSLLELASLSPLVLIPLTLGYSVVKFRLTDVDV